MNEGLQCDINGSDPFDFDLLYNPGLELTKIWTKLFIALSSGKLLGMIT